MTKISTRVKIMAKKVNVGLTFLNNILARILSMKTLYLHIGTPKTATTSIQIFLEQNREQLNKYNYDFPMLPFKYPNDPARRNGRFLYHRDAEIRKDPSVEAEKLRNDQLNIGLNMIHESFQKCDNVIVTEENLWYATAYDSQNYLQILPEDAAKYGYSIKIIVYLRRQDQLISSVWNQHIKKGQTDKTLPEYIDYIMKKRPLYLAYDQMLEIIADVFGLDNIIVRRFEKSSWVEHSIISDFMDALGLDPSLPFSKPEREYNLRLNEDDAEIQRLINGAEFLSDEEKKYLAKYTKRLSYNTKISTNFSQFTEEETVSFLSHFEEGNLHVAQTYIGDDKPLFSDKISVFPIWQPDGPSMVQESIRFSLYLFDDMYKQLEDLKLFRNKVRHPFHALKEKLFSK